MNYMTANEVLDNVRKGIEELESMKGIHFYENPTYNRDRHEQACWGSDKYKFKIRAVYKEFEIFDWWDEFLSMNQLKKMEAFLKQAISLGFTGCVCFQPGSVGWANGMWAFKKGSTDGDFLYHTFANGENSYSLQINDEMTHGLTLKQVKEILKK